MFRAILTIIVVCLSSSRAAGLQGESAFFDLPEISHQGSGETTLLIIPCMSCRWKSWDTFMERNKERYNMYAVTIPGFGGTVVPDLPLNTDGTPWRDNALEALSRLIDREGLEDIILIGQSWGSMIAVQLSARWPNRVAKLINVDGSLVSQGVLDSSQARLQAASDTITEWSAKLSDPEQWRTFNGGGDTLRARTAWRDAVGLFRNRCG